LVDLEDVVPNGNQPLHCAASWKTIIYDSKNHKAFRTEHVTKLLADQARSQGGSRDPFPSQIPPRNRATA
jgi:hypothetical protein